MVLLEKPYLTIIYDEAINCIQQNWKGFAKSDDFREGILASLEYLKEKKADKILSNTKDFSVVKKADTDWVAKEITPIMVQQGMRMMAFIVPTNAFTKLSVNNFKEDANSIVSIAYFDDVQKAKEWMAEAKAIV